MKKMLSILLALVLTVALFAGCKKADSGETVEEPTKEPEVTAVPATEEPVVTEAPVTEAPTPTPEPTPEPYPDPYRFEILDQDEAEIQALSFDTIKQNGRILADGSVASYRLDIEDTIDGTDGKTSTVSMRGWLGFFEEELLGIGYQIDQGPVVFSKSFFETTQPEVKAAGGEFAQRFCVDIPVANLAGAQHELKIVCKVESGLYYLNSEVAPFVLFYDGPEAGEAAIDGTINVGEYNTQFTMDKTNFQTWTGTKIAKRTVTYYMSQKEDGVYVGIVATNIADGDALQLNFNPGARLEEVAGLFVSVIAGDTFKILQHNHKTLIKDDDNAAGVDISDLIEGKAVVDGTTYTIEFKLPVDFFKVTDVADATEFEYGVEKLYYGMFAVLSGEGYTNQSEAPGSSWFCKDLGIHEYYAY